MTTVGSLTSGGLQSCFDQGIGQCGLTLTGGREASLHAVAEGHPFVDFGEDAILLIQWPLYATPTTPLTMPRPAAAPFAPPCLEGLVDNRISAECA